MSEIVTDLKFPLEYNEGSGKTTMNNIEEDVRQSLLLLLGTRKGERLCRPNYGCDLAQFAFENVGFTLITRIENEILQAIDLYEPRVTNVKVSLSNNEENDLNVDALIVNIQYTIKENALKQTASFRLGEKF